jgi:hypothetical protein
MGHVDDSPGRATKGARGKRKRVYHRDPARTIRDSVHRPPGRSFDDTAPTMPEARLDSSRPGIPRGTVVASVRCLWSFAMRLARLMISVGSFAASTLALPNLASADVGRQSASGVAKGTIGGALLGAELVLAIEAAADVESPWAYLGGGLAGAAAGGVGGYFVEQNASPRVSMLLLAGGLTLAIPTTVAVLSATAYEPPADYLVDAPPSDEPIADPPQPASAPAAPGAPAATPAPTPGPGAAPPPTSPAPTSSQRRHPSRRVARVRPLYLTPPALLDFSPGRLALSIPAVEITGTYTERELVMFGLEQKTEVRVPFLNILF